MTSENVVWILVAWTIRSTVLFAFVGLLLWIFRARDVSLRLSVWTVALVGALLLPVLSLSTAQTLIPVPRLMAAPEAVAVTGAAASFPGRVPLGFLRTPGRRQSEPWPAIFVAVWLAGVLLAMLRIFAGAYFSRRLVRSSREIDIGTRESAAVTVPVVVGFLRPVILLPSDWREWGPEKLQAVLAHERAHVRRRDPLRRLASSLYRGLCWFHPLAWWVSAHLAELAEAASDDAALLAIENETLYAEMLVGFWQLVPRRVPWEGIGMARGGKLTRRMQRILDSDRRLSRGIARRTLLAVVIVAVPVIYFTASALPVWAAPEIRPPAPPAPPAVVLASRRTLPSPRRAEVAAQAAVLSDVYSTWLNRDVVYIITDTERVGFNRLRSDEERNAFIEQFWLRRDPTPGTPENEFKDEHYRRIAYVNQRFVESRPGWKTDRGRLYIIFGPPNEIESHPSRGRDGEPPHESWLYWHIEGVGDSVTWLFVDVGASGNYELSDSKPEVSSRPDSGPLLPFTISIPLGGGGERVTVIGRVSRTDEPDGRTRIGFQSFAEGREYRREIRVPAGLYRLDAVVKRQDGSMSQTESYFDVK